MRIISFGYLHDEPPPAHLTLDLRDLFRDPHIDLAMRQLTGLNQRVYDNVMAQPNATRFVRALANAARVLDEATQHVVVAIGCAGGRHRSVAVARALAVELTIGFRTVTTEHRDVSKPVVQREVGDAS